MCKNINYLNYTTTLYIICMNNKLLGYMNMKVLLAITSKDLALYLFSLSAWCSTLTASWCILWDSLSFSRTFCLFLSANSLQRAASFLSSVAFCLLALQILTKSRLIWNLNVQCWCQNLRLVLVLSTIIYDKVGSCKA